VETVRARAASPPHKLAAVTCTLLAIFALYLALISALARGLAWAPRDMTLHLFKREFGLVDLGWYLFQRGVVLGMLLPALFAVELLLGGWAESSLRRLLLHPSRSAWSDIAAFLFWHSPGHMLVHAGLSLGLVLLPAAWLHRTLANATGLSIELGSWPLALQVIAFFFVASFFDYWQHRLDHTARFWPLHRYHHSAEDFCALTAIRVHPAAPTGVMLLIPGVLIGVSGAALFWFTALNVMVHFLIHTRITSDFGWIGRWVIQSPVAHRLHHKLDMSKPTCNYSLVPLWDRLFGTWREPEGQQVPIGVAAPYRHGVWILPDLLRDYWHFWLALAGRYRDEANAAPMMEALRGAGGAMRVAVDAAAERTTSLSSSS
jgi:sterol desaturase/sphingolipid hydroxylase (fatty acid hydroxylase superfamily)